MIPISSFTSLSIIVSGEAWINSWKGIYGQKCDFCFVFEYVIIKNSESQDRGLWKIAEIWLHFYQFLNIRLLHRILLNSIFKIFSKYYFQRFSLGLLIWLKDNFSTKSLIRIITMKKFPCQQKQKLQNYSAIQTEVWGILIKTVSNLARLYFLQL